MEFEHKFEVHNKACNELKTKIELSKVVLVGLKRKAALATNLDTADGSAAATDAKKSKDSGVYDPSKLLRRLRTRIKQIHVDQIGQGEVDSKATLALLNEIENVIIRYSRKIHVRRINDADAVNKQE